MKFIAYVVAMIFFVGGLLLMGYAFEVSQGMAFMFFGGIVAVGVALAIPAHMMGKQSY